MLEPSKPKPMLTQVQIIQSLAEALAWFEKELNWGVAPAELSHLTGRIGELYAAMITRGQMALEINQPGYDVVSSTNERISVKTVTTSSHVSFNASTFEYVDRVIVLRVNVDDELGISVEELLDEPQRQPRARCGSLTASTCTPSHRELNGRSAPSRSCVSQPAQDTLTLRSFGSRAVRYAFCETE